MIKSVSIGYLDVFYGEPEWPGLINTYLRQAGLRA